jgi:hypothetical protein
MTNLTIECNSHIYNNKTSNSMYTLNEAKAEGIINAHIDGLKKTNQKFKFDLKSQTETETKSKYSDLSAKALTVSNAGGLIGTHVSPLINLLRIGGVWLNSGIDFRNNATGNQIFGVNQSAGGYKPQGYMAATANDIGKYSSISVSADVYVAEVNYANQLAARADNLAELVFATEVQLENEKKVLLDNLINIKILTSPDVLAVDPATVTVTSGKIFTTLNSMVTEKSNIGYGAPVIHTSVAGFNKLINEQNTLGDTIRGSLLTRYEKRNELQKAGLPVGDLDGTPIYINPQLGSTYSTSTAGRVQFTPGAGALDFPTFPTGNKTVFIVALPLMIGALAGNADLDIITNFSNDRYGFQNGIYTIGGQTVMGAGVVLGEAISYYAV